MRLCPLITITYQPPPIKQPSAVCRHKPPAALLNIITITLIQINQNKHYKTPRSPIRLVRATAMETCPTPRLPRAPPSPRARRPVPNLYSSPRDTFQMLSTRLLLSKTYKTKMPGVLRFTVKKLTRSPRRFSDPRPTACIPKTYCRPSPSAKPNKPSGNCRSSAG